MLYFELGLHEEDYLTDKECSRFGRFRRIVWWIKAKLGIVVKKKIENKFVYVVPKVNKKFLKKISKIAKISGQKQVCFSDELFYRDEFLNLFKDKDIYMCDSSWILKYMLINILDYIGEITNIDYAEIELAFLVKDDIEKVTEYIKILASKFKIITVVTNNIKYFSKVGDKLLKEDGIDINLGNNYKKSLNKSKIIVNMDFGENEIRKYTICSKGYFINLDNKYEIEDRNFEGVNISGMQIAMPNKYLIYAELFYNFNYLNVYESFVKKRTSFLNIINEIKKDDVKIICLENQKGIVKKDNFFVDDKKILDK